jgi:hypothetical protein
MANEIGNGDDKVDVYDFSNFDDITFSSLFGTVLFLVRDKCFYRYDNL